MYQSSSQRKFWTYRNEQELAELRAQHNQKFIERFGIDMDVSWCWKKHFHFTQVVIIHNYCRTTLLLNPSLHQTRNEFCWNSMNYIWKSFANDSNLKCQSRWWAQLSITLNASIRITHRWTIIRRKFCKLNLLTISGIFNFFLIILEQLVSTYPVRLKSSTFRSINVWRTSKETESRLWT